MSEIPENFEFHKYSRWEDLIGVHLPNRVHLAESASSGKFPLLYEGSPFVGTWESAVFYPINYIYTLLPFNLAVNIEIIFHILLIGLGMYVFCRHSQRLHWSAAVFGASLLMISGQVIGRIYPGHLSNLATMAWFPLIFWGIDRTLKGRSSIPLCLFLLFHLFAGHPQYVYFGGLVAIVFIFFHPRFNWSGLRKITFSYALAAGLAAIQIIPAAGVFLSSKRSGGEFSFSASFFFPFENIITMINPLFFGNFKDYLGLFNGWEATFFFGGFIAVLFAIVSIVMERPKHLLIVAGITFILALGVQTPLYDFLFKTLPIFSSFRGVCKFLFFTTFFLCVLSARGFNYSTGNRK